VKVLPAIAALAVLAVAVALIDRVGDSPALTEADAGASGDVVESPRSADVRLPDLPPPDPEPSAKVPPPDPEPSAKVPLPDPEPPAKVPAPSNAIAHVRSGERVELHDEPGGRVLETVGDRTEFGSVRTFWIAQVRGDWLGVPVTELPNGRLAWIEDDRDALEVFQTPFWIAADVSARRLELRYGRKVLDRFPVTVGSPGSPTPLGRYSVTDGLVGPDFGPDYGCCILALTGHQPQLPPGWIGGDRIAIHGTPGSVGGASSGGCLRASNPDLASIFTRVPLGAPVFIRA
jgi:L,D-transpeptidase catalytic domain